MSTVFANPAQTRPDNRFDWRFGAANRRYPLADGDAGIARTVQWMSGLAKGSEGANHPLVRRTALEITRGLDSKDKTSQIAAVLNWLKSNLDFRGEYKELLQSPVVTIQLGAGDCDDHSMLAAALLKTLGYNTRFHTVAADPEDPAQFSHVFCEVYDPNTGEWTALDSTVPRSFPGWRPEAVYRTKSWAPLGDAGDDIAADVLPFAQLAEPLVQAEAYNISGATPGLTNIFGNSAGTATVLGLPWYIALLLAAGAVWIIKRN